MFTTADRLARIRALEEQRSVLAAEQAAEAAALMAERRAEVEVEIATVPRPGVGSRRRREEADRQVVAEIAKARRISPAQAQRWVAWAVAAPVDTLKTWQLLAAGEVSERRAVTVQQLAAVLPAERRRQVDAELAPQLTGAKGLGDRKVDTATRAAVYRADPAGACERAAYAANERRVTTRPAPDTMGWLTTLAPVTQIVAARAALEQAVKTAKASGDSRSRGQIMADTLIERVTGQATATGVPVSVELVITDRTLLGADEPAHLADGTPVPAPLARDLVLDAGAALRVRRLFTDPAGRIVTGETHSRDFTPAMATLIRLRDQTCSTEWCDAAIRHTDHHIPHVRGGPTSISNGRGLCARCNLNKAATPPDPLPDRPPRRRQRRSRSERLAKRRIAAAIKQQRCTLQQSELSTCGVHRRHGSAAV